MRCLYTALERDGSPLAALRLAAMQRNRVIVAEIQHRPLAAHLFLAEGQPQVIESVSLYPHYDA